MDERTIKIMASLLMIVLLTTIGLAAILFPHRIQAFAIEQARPLAKMSLFGVIVKWPLYDVTIKWIDSPSYIVYLRVVGVYSLGMAGMTVYLAYLYLTGK